ncbi:hypothetical protein C8A00DRAFT_18410 [Chaetomidium leptoderma]|uniref:Uncharacterized protein n=1 Tax=Chaetomidium leptoderma TaxID=669021 RepID=A0AAN6VF86_9PEZI|nr:hypothetical protein C8A00DRAFT_18410 [Chaetomidium leptoderma]
MCPGTDINVPRAPLILAQSSIPDGNTGIAVTTVTVPTTVSDHVQTGCPTVTATRELCTTCPVLACLALSTVTQSCGCPTPIPTVNLDFPCGEECDVLGCSTSYTIVTASGCSDDVPNATSHSVPITTSFAPNATVSMPSFSPPGSSSTAMSTVSVGAAGRMRVPFRLW